MKKYITSFMIFCGGIIAGISINSMYAETSKNEIKEEIKSSIHQEQVYINGVRYTVVTSNAPSMVIMR